MTDDARLATLLRGAADEIDRREGVTDPARIHALVGAGVTRGRRRRRRRRVVGVVGAAAVAVVGAALLVDGPTTRALDPADPTEPTSSAGPAASGAASPSVDPSGAAGSEESDESAAPRPGRPRALAVAADQLPDVVAGLLPGPTLTLAPAKAGEDNPSSGVDPRDRAATTTYPASEPGPGVAVDLLRDGVQVRLGVEPTQPGTGDTALQRCRAAGEGGNGECVETADGGVLQQVQFASDEGDTVRVVSRWTPDLWQVTALTQGPAAASPSLDELVAVVSSDVWFG